GRQDHPGRLFRRHGHQSVLRSHGTYPPLPRHRLSAGGPAAPGARRRHLLRHGLLSGGRHRAIPQRPAGHSGHGGRPGGWGHPGLLPVPGSVPAPGSRPEAHALRQAK
ncbi:V-type ATP synthase subunit F, partial [Dysosmobacter welbionis]